MKIIRGKENMSFDICVFFVDKHTVVVDIRQVQMSEMSRKQIKPLKSTCVPVFSLLKEQEGN